MSAAGRNRLPSGAATPTAGMFQVISLGDASEQQVREYKRRRPHKKSHGGCQSCKLRRVKCDQATPACLRCRRNRRECVYDHPVDSQTPPALPRARSAFGTSAVVSVRRPVPASVVPIHAPPPVPRPPLPQPFQATGPEYGTPSSELLHHVLAVGEGIFAMPNFMGAFVPTAMQFSHFRGTLLAVAASHLYHKAPGFRRYQLAKHYQQTIALQSYQGALSTPFVRQGQVGVDALLMTAMLMNMLSFVLPMEESEAAKIDFRPSPTTGRLPPCPDPDPDPRCSWVFSTQPNRLGWLALQMGLTPLLIATAPWHEKSRLRLLFANSDDERRTLSGTWQSLHRVPAAWLDVFGLTRHAPPVPRGVRRPHPGVHNDPASPVETLHSDRGGGSASGVSSPAASTHSSQSSGSDGSDGSSNSRSSCANAGARGVRHSGGVPVTAIHAEEDRLFRGPLRVVAELLNVPATQRTLLLYFQFVGQLDHGFRQRLLVRDERALWLFGMWMGLLCRHEDVWWTRRRARCDFRAIRLWLHLVGVDRRPAREGALWRQLLRDLDGTWGYDFATDPIMQRM